MPFCLLGGHRQGLWRQLSITEAGRALKGSSHSRLLAWMHSCPLQACSVCSVAIARGSLLSVSCSLSEPLLKHDIQHLTSPSEESWQLCLERSLLPIFTTFRASVFPRDPGGSLCGLTPRASPAVETPQSRWGQKDILALTLMFQFFLKAKVFMHCLSN